MSVKVPTNGASKCRQLDVEGLRGRGRSRKTWMECVDDDMGTLNLPKEDAQDRVVWRNGILGPVQPVQARKQGR